MTVLPLQVRFVKDHKDAKLPTRGSRGAAGLDLYSVEQVVIPPGQTRLVLTGLKMELPAGYEAQVRSRSGLALKHSVSVLNSPGTIDEDYRGLIGAALHNHGDKAFTVVPGDRIAQMVIQPCITQHIQPIEAEELSDTDRGEGGFGSTGR